MTVVCGGPLLAIFSGSVGRLALYMHSWYANPWPVRRHAIYASAFRYATPTAGKDGNLAAVTVRDVAIPTQDETRIPKFLFEQAAISREDLLMVSVAATFVNSSRSEIKDFFFAFPPPRPFRIEIMVSERLVRAYRSVVFQIVLLGIVSFSQPGIW